MKTNHAEKEALREVFGDDWRGGLRKNPEIESRRRCPSSFATQARENKHAEREKEKNRILLASMEKCYKKHGEVDAKYMNAAKNLLTERGL